MSKVTCSRSAEQAYTTGGTGKFTISLASIVSTTSLKASCNQIKAAWEKTWLHYILCLRSRKRGHLLLLKLRFHGERACRDSPFHWSAFMVPKSNVTTGFRNLGWQYLRQARKMAITTASAWFTWWVFILATKFTERILLAKTRFEVLASMFMKTEIFPTLCLLSPSRHLVSRRHYWLQFHIKIKKFKQMTSPHPVTKFPAFTEPEGSLLHSQVTHPSLSWTRSTQSMSPIPLVKHLFKYHFPSTPRSSK